MTLLRLSLVALLGLAVGAGAMLGLQGMRVPGDAAGGSGAPAAGDAARTPGVAVTGAPRAAPPASPTPAAVKPAPVPEPPDRVLLAWTPGGLEPGFDERVAASPRVEATTTVSGGLAELASSVDPEGRRVDTPPEGFVVPLDVIAFDPATYPAFVPASPKAAIAGLADGEALLGSTSAELRGLDEGAELELASGDRLTVAGVVDDAVIGGAEVAITTATARAVGVADPRYLLLAYRGERAATEQAVRAAAGGAAVRLRGPGETPVFRHGDAVLTQAAVKERFGEFAYRRAGDGALVLDPAWEREHLVAADVPLLGRVRCHRALLPALEGALAELERRNLAALVDPDGFAGCHAARLTASGQSVSRHAWGIAVDLNWPDNPAGQSSAQDQRLVEVLERWGFGWGGDWLVPDPAHFEYVRPPTGA